MSDFFTKNGKVVSNLAEMADALESMNDEDYSHHVTEEKNDIANWVRDVHKNEKLAEALQKAQNKATMIELLREVEDAVKENEELSEPAKFPTEDYHPTDGMGKEDLQMDDTYKKPEEWNAAKELVHPEEEIKNPAVHEEETKTASEDKPFVAPEKTLEEKNEVSMEEKPSVETKEKIPADLRPPIPGPTLKDRLIPGIIGLIIGLIIGYFVARFLF